MGLLQKSWARRFVKQIGKMEPQKEVNIGTKLWCRRKDSPVIATEVVPATSEHSCLCFSSTCLKFQAWMSRCNKSCCLWSPWWKWPRSYIRSKSWEKALLIFWRSWRVRSTNTMSVFVVPMEKKPWSRNIIAWDTYRSKLKCTVSTPIALPWRPSIDFSNMAFKIVLIRSWRTRTSTLRKSWCGFYCTQMRPLVKAHVLETYCRLFPTAHCSGFVGRAAKAFSWNMDASGPMTLSSRTWAVELWALAWRFLAKGSSFSWICIKLCLGYFTFAPCAVGSDSRPLGPHACDSFFFNSGPLGRALLALPLYGRWHLS